LDAILFDLDGVISQTAVIHARAWERLFNEFLTAYAHRTGATIRPFTIQLDYPVYVDGKPRVEGVRSFLASRNITVPAGSPGDGPDASTVYGLAKKKDAYFKEALGETGARLYPSTIRLAKLAKARGLKTAVVSASHHCREILEHAGIASLFDTRVDGYDIDRLQLPGKPAPDTFLEAARRLQVMPARAAVIEDAQAGVRAGRSGGFGLVIGLDRQHQAEALREQGADIVVPDLEDLLPPLA
jgi:alpha,alpha-trehalase